MEIGAHQLRKQHAGLGKPNFDEVTAKGEVKCASLRWVSGKVWVRMKPFGEKNEDMKHEEEPEKRRPRRLNEEAVL